MKVDWVFMLLGLSWALTGFVSLGMIHMGASILMGVSP